MNNKKTTLTSGNGGVAALMTAALAVAVLLAAPGTCNATAKLWLYPDSDHPRNGGHVIAGSEFTVFVENVGNGNADNTAYDARLVVAVNDPGLLTSISGDLALGPGDFVVLGSPTLPVSGKTVPPHGVYPTYFVEVDVGDIAEGVVLSFSLTVDGLPGLEVHFDAIAYGVKQAGKKEKQYDVINPSGHDVTVVLDGAVEPESECPYITIEKSIDSTGVILGEDVVYLMEVTNPAECAVELTGVEVREDIPAVGDPATPAFTVQTAVPPADAVAVDSLTWLIGTLAPGDTETIELTVQFVEEADGQEVENTACVSADGVAEMCDSVEAAVGETPADGAIASPGFWCNRIRFVLEDIPGASYTEEQLLAFLAAVDESSAVFPLEEGVPTTPEAAQEILCNPQGSDASEKLLRHLLALWLNVASERIGLEVILGDLCPGNEPLPDGADPEMTVEEVLEAAEAAYLAPADPSELLFWKDVIDFINNAYPATEGECLQAFQHALRHNVRRGRGHH